MVVARTSWSEQRGTAFAVKAEVGDPEARTLEFPAQKTMYGGKHIASGDTVYVFASENEGGRGLVARGIVTSEAAIPRCLGVVRQTPRVSVTVRCTARATRPLGRAELRPLINWADRTPALELNFKLYRQATNKVVGLSAAAAAYLEDFF